MNSMRYGPATAIAVVLALAGTTTADAWIDIHYDDEFEYDDGTTRLYFNHHACEVGCFDADVHGGAGSDGERDTEPTFLVTCRFGPVDYITVRHGDNPGNNPCPVGEPITSGTVIHEGTDVHDRSATHWVIVGMCDAHVAAEVNGDGLHDTPTKVPCLRVKLYTEGPPEW